MNIGDMYFAATLLAYGAELVDINREDPRHQKFQFGGEIKQIFVIEPGTNVILRIENPSFNDVKTKFIGKTLMLPPEYVDSIRRIKAAIHDY